MPRFCSLICLTALSVVIILLLLDVSHARKWKQIGKRQTRGQTTTRKSTSFRGIIKLINQGKNKNKKAKTTAVPKVISTTISTDSVTVFNARIKIHNGRTDKKQQFVPPQVLDKLRRVTNFRDFIKEFHPKGVSVKKRLIPKIESAARFESDTFVLSSDDGGDSKLSASKQEEEEVLQFDSASPLRSSSESNEILQPSSDLVTPRCEIKEFIREIPVDLDFHGIMYPSCIKVHECSGCCVNTFYMECAPVRVQISPQIAFKVSFSGPIETTAVQVNVTHHIECGCQCKVKASDCLPTQTYSAANCQCECPKTAQRCPLLKAWHPVQCACKCSYPRDCKSRRRYWDEETCTCACKRDPCPAGQFRNMRTCGCTPLPR